MHPRLKTSLKWTSLPPELLAQIREVYEEAFAAAIKDQSAKFIAEGRVYAEELLFRIGFLEKGRLTQANFEVSLDFNSTKQNALEQIHFVVDCAASLLQQYFDNDRDLHEFPREWQELTIDKRKLYFRVSTENTALEAEADRLLGVDSNNLVQGDDDDADERAVISLLGLNKLTDNDNTDDPDDESGGQTH